MNLNDAQLATLKAHILASTDQAVIDARAIRNDTELTRLYNLPSAVNVWQTMVSEDTFLDSYVFTEMDSLNAAKQFQLGLLLKRGWLDASRPTVRAGLAEVFKGAALAATRAAILEAIKRPATVAESIFVVEAGTGATKNLGWQGTLTTDDVGRAMNG